MVNIIEEVGIETALGAALVGAGLLSPQPRTSAALILSGGGVLAFAAFRTLGAVEDVARDAAEAGFSQDQAVATGETIGGPGGLAGSLFETIGGAASRLLTRLPGAGVVGVENVEPEPGVAVVPGGAATTGPHLGTPKNIFRVAGVIREPQNGGQVVPGVGFNSWLMDAAIENQSNMIQKGRVSVEVKEDAFVAGSGEVLDATIPGPELELQPGEFVELSIRVPILTPLTAGFLRPNADATARLKWNSFTTDRIAFRRR